MDTGSGKTQVYDQCGLLAMFAELITLTSSRALLRIMYEADRQPNKASKRESTLENLMSDTL